MRLYRFFHEYAAKTFLIAVAIVGALLLVGGVATAALPTSALPVTGAIVPTTTTTLTTSPVSQAVQGTLVTLTAKVTPQAAAGVAPQVPAGTVQFKDGPNNLGNPVQVVLSTGTTVGTISGTAVGTISQLTVGPHQLSAVFTPSDRAAVFATSTSPTVPFTVIASSTGPVDTRTSLSTSSPSTVAQDTPVALVATVSPPAAAGTVQFKDGTADLGSPAPVSNGTASETTLIPTAGSHQLFAVFTPTDSAAFTTSTSQPISLTVTAPSQAGTSQAQQSGQSLDGPGPTVLDAQGLTVLNLDLGGSADGGGLTLLGGQGASGGGGLTLLGNGGATGGGLTLLGNGGVADGRGLTVLDSRGLTVLRTEDNRGGGLLSNLLHALL
jgi:Big-like domain-containing protein